MDVSFCELRNKDVVNICDGKKFGRIIDIIFSCESGCVKGIVIPCTKRLFFSKAQEVFIPWKCIKRLGNDVILVDVNSPEICGMEAKIAGFGQKNNIYANSYNIQNTDIPHQQNEDKPNEIKESNLSDDDRPKCDGRCDKCMLFDCAHRWKYDSAY